MVHSPVQEMPGLAIAFCYPKAEDVVKRNAANFICAARKIVLGCVSVLSLLRMFSIENVLMLD
jgi:hypothetical protein